jgi:crotonobetainyl-CoA:carnitine CoA-transferase CaiB-like acyl-CoA transferase
VGAVNEQRTGPLAGVRVIEVANFLSGPLATAMLGDLGAEVIKVEPPKGDPFRRFGRSGTPVSSIFVNANRGKTGVVLDLKQETDQARLHELLDAADMMVTNWRPQVAARLGVVDDDLVRRNPKLIRVYISGFGSTGPLADRPVFDGIVQGHLGAGQSTPPSVVGSYVVDKTSAAMVVQAALAALYSRERTGVAERIDLALLDAAAYVNFPDVMANRTFVDHEPEEAGNRQAAAVRAIQASDGWLVVAPVTADQIRSACAAVGRAELADELLTMMDATALTIRVMDELETVTKSAPVAHWVDAFEAHDVPAGPCLTIDQHLADAQVAHNHLYDITDADDLGRLRRVRYPARFSTWGELWPSPILPPRPKRPETTR